MIYVFILGLLHAADWLLTHRIIAAGGSELNWLMAWLLNRWGFAGLAVFKGAVVACTAVAVAIFSELWWLAAGFCVLYVGVVIWNSLTLWKLTRRKKRHSTV